MSNTSSRIDTFEDDFEATIAKHSQKAAKETSSDLDALVQAEVVKSQDKPVIKPLEHYQVSDSEFFKHTGGNVLESFKLFFPDFNMSKLTSQFLQKYLDRLAQAARTIVQIEIAEYDKTNLNGIIKGRERYCTSGKNKGSKVTLLGFKAIQQLPVKNKEGRVISDPREMVVARVWSKPYKEEIVATKEGSEKAFWAMLNNLEAAEIYKKVQDKAKVQGRPGKFGILWSVLWTYIATPHSPCWNREDVKVAFSRLEQEHGSRLALIPRKSIKS